MKPWKFPCYTVVWFVLVFYWKGSSKERGNKCKPLSCCHGVCLGSFELGQVSSPGPHALLPAWHTGCSASIHMWPWMKQPCWLSWGGVRVSVSGWRLQIQCTERMCPEVQVTDIPSGARQEEQLIITNIYWTLSVPVALLCTCVDHLI